MTLFRYYFIHNIQSISERISSKQIELNCQVTPGDCPLCYRRRQKRSANARLYFATFNITDCVITGNLIIVYRLVSFYIYTGCMTLALVEEIRVNI